VGERSHYNATDGLKSLKGRDFFAPESPPKAFLLLQTSNGIEIFEEPQEEKGSGK